MATDATETKHDMLLEVTEPKGPGKQEKMSAFSDFLKRQRYSDHVTWMSVFCVTVSLRPAWCGDGFDVSL